MFMCHTFAICKMGALCSSMVRDQFVCALETFLIMWCGGIMAICTRGAHTKNDLTLLKVEVVWHPSGCSSKDPCYDASCR